MKVHILPVLIMAMYICTVSCSEMLETKNYTDISPDNFFNTEADFDAALNGLYLPCSTSWGYRDEGTGEYQTTLFCAGGGYYPNSMYTTDIIRPYSTNSFSEFNFGPASAGLHGVYYHIRFVARATDIINRIEHSTGSTAQIRDKFIAEAKTLRAFYMFVLYDWFGPVNVRLNADRLNDTSVQPRPTEEEYLGFMIKDLNDAIATDSFPDKYNSVPSEWGRMSKAIARSILLKVYMQSKDWVNARDTASEIMRMGFRIIPSYEDVFNEKITDENIWSIPSNTSMDNYYVSEVLPNDFKRGYNISGRAYIRGNESNYFSGWRMFAMWWEFYDTFEDSDVRKQTIICEYDASDGTHKDRYSGMLGAIPLKFTDTEYPNFGIQKAQPIIRYAEVLLSFAEAENEINGPDAKAIEALKQITDRAGVHIPDSALSSKESFRDYLLLERGHELYGEGQRRQDLIRHGKFIENARKRGRMAKDYQTLFPIPSNVIIESGGIIEQNEGY